MTVYGPVRDRRLPFPQPGWIAWHLHQAGSRRAHRFQPRIARVGHTNAIDDEIIAVNVWFERTNRHAPETVLVRQRFRATGPFTGDFDLLYVRRPQAEGDGFVWVDFGRDQGGAFAPRRLIGARRVLGERGRECSKR